MDNIKLIEHEELYEICYNVVKHTCDKLKGFLRCTKAKIIGPYIHESDHNTYVHEYCIIWDVKGYGVQKIYLGVNVKIEDTITFSCYIRPRFHTEKELKDIIHFIKVDNFNTEAINKVEVDLSNLMYEDIDEIISAANKLQPKLKGIFKYIRGI